MTDNVRQLVTIRTVNAVEEIPGANAIERLTIGGWIVVSKKGIHQPGDHVFYFEIDSALPLDNPLFADLGVRGKKLIEEKEYHILKTIRLRGVYSQGFVIPVSAVVELYPETEHWPSDKAMMLGVIKDEPKIPMSLAGNVKGKFPTELVLKTDSERVQNLTGVYETLRKDFSWFATEKIDGSSVTIIKDEDGTLRVCSRNWELQPPKEGETPNTFWRLALEVADIIKPGEIIQGEVYGEGIQGNRLKIKGQKLAVFNLVVDYRYIPEFLWCPKLQELAVPILDLELPETVQGALDQVDGMKSQINPQALAEGVVWHTSHGHVPLELGRANFKAISNKFLLKSS